MYNRFVTLGAWKESPKTHNSLTLPYTMHAHTCTHMCMHTWFEEKNLFSIVNAQTERPNFYENVRRDINEGTTNTQLY